MTDKISDCVSICESTVTGLCNIKNPTEDLKSDCESQCVGDVSFISGGPAGLELISQNGCDKYFVLPKLKPLERVNFNDMIVPIGLIVGVGIFLLLCPPIFVPI